MATSFNPDALRGLLIADPRIDPASPSSLSTYTQADPSPGIPVPATPSAMTLSTSGGQVDGLTIDVRTIRAGGAVVNNDVAPGAFVWREDGGPWIGWDGPSTYNGFEPVHTWTTGVGIVWYTYPYVTFTPSGTRLVSTRKGPSLSTVQTLSVHRRPLGGVSSIIDVTSAVNTLQPFHSCIVQLPGDRLLLLATCDDLSSAGIQVKAWLSTDDGATWALQNAACLPSNIDTTTTEIRRVRAAYFGGQILLMIAVRKPALTIPDTFLQYVSVDNGMSYSLVEEVDASSATSVHCGGVHDIVALPDIGFCVVYCGSSRTNYGANSEILSKTFATAFTRWTYVEPNVIGFAPSASLSVGNQLSDSTELCASVDNDGQIYLLAPDMTFGARVAPVRSADGLTWTMLGSVVASGRACIDYAGEMPASMTCAWYAGALHLIHTVDSTTVYDDQLGDTILSGFTTATAPMIPAVQSSGDYSSPSYLTWEPYWLPTAVGWTSSSAGTPTATLTGGALQISTAAADSLLYIASAASPATTNHVVQAFWEVDVDSGPSALTILFADTVAHGYHVNVKVTPTSVIVEDQTGSTTLVTYARTGSNYIHVRAWVSNNGATGKVTVWVDEADGSTGAARNYVCILNGAALGDSPTGTARQSVRFGNSTHGVLSTVSNWRYAAPQFSTQMSSPHNVVIPDGLNGRAFTSRGTVLSQDLSLHAIGGPSAVNDEWKIPARFAHGVSSLGIPSPSVTWRSADTSTAQVFVWETSTTVASISPLMGPIGALFIGGANFRTATLEGRNAAGVWASIGTWDASSGQASLAWDRKADVVLPSTANASSGVYWYPHAALDGMRWTFDTATGPVRTIRYQTEGAWTKELTKRARLAVYGDVSAVAANGTAGAVMASSGVLVWNIDGQYSAYRLTIPVQPVAEAYYEMGVVKLGHLAVFGRRYSWGRNLTTEPNVALTTGRNGRRAATVLGPPRRGVEFGWTDAADQSMFTTDQTSERPDYYFGSSTGTPDPAAAKNDGPALMRGIVDHLNGSAEPVVYLGYLPRVALGTSQMVVHPDLHMYGRIVSDVSLETVQGREWAGTGSTGEMTRTSNIRLEEEL